ncbi:MAG: hypothetical protein F6K28_45385, partial [Microcoleus sp. SIO2G3]|nr:hypothetical protein [Microcoleus sp. SIO2G3]
MATKFEPEPKFYNQEKNSLLDLNPKGLNNYRNQQDPLKSGVPYSVINPVEFQQMSTSATRQNSLLTFGVEAVHERLFREAQLAQGGVDMAFVLERYGGPHAAP